MSALTSADIQQFLDLGFLHIPGAVAPDIAESCAQRTLALLGIDEHDPATWGEHAQRTGSYRANRPHDDPDIRRYAFADYAPKLWEVCCAVSGGAERLQQPCTFREHGITKLPDRDQPWLPPHPDRGGWHVDGSPAWFDHYLDSPQVGLLVLVLFRDCQHQGGGTFFVPDSVGKMCRFYADHPVGRCMSHEETRAMLHTCQDFREITGKAGDAFVLHPFMVHSYSTNARREIRILENPNLSLREPMCFDRPDGTYSLVEQATLRHLGVERLDFRRQPPHHAVA